MTRGRDTFVVDVPIEGGLAEKVSENLIKPPLLAEADNVVRQKTGRLSKRNGYEAAITSLPPEALINGIFDYNGQLHANTSGGVYRFVDEEGVWKRTNESGVFPCELRTRNIAYQDATPVNCSTAFVEGAGREYIVAVWDEFDTSTWPTGETWITIREADTNEISVPPTRLEGLGWQPQVCVINDTDVLVFASDPNAETIKVRHIDMTASPIDVNANPNVNLVGQVERLLFDAHSIPSDSVAYVIYRENGFGGPTHIMSVDNNPAIVANLALGAAYDCTHGNTVFRNSVTGNLVCGVIQNSGNDIVAFTQDLALTAPGTGAANVIYSVDTLNFAHDKLTIGMRLDSGECWIASSGEISDSINHLLLVNDERKDVKWRNLDLTAAGTGATGAFKNAELDTKAFRGPGLPPMVGIRTGSGSDDAIGAPVSELWKGIFGTTGYHCGLVVSPYVFETEPKLRPIATYLGDRLPAYYIDPSTTAAGAPATKGGGIRQRIAHLGSSASMTDPNKFLFHHIHEVELPDIDFDAGLNPDNTYYGVAQIELDLDPLPIRVKQYGDLVLFSGGYVGCYDGELSFENTPLSVPGKPAVVAVAGNDLLDNADYQYRLVWEFHDALGLIHRSSPGVPFLVTIAANEEAQVDWLRPSLPTANTASSRDLKVEIYRTEGGGSLFRRVAEVDEDLAFFDNFCKGRYANDTLPDDELVFKEFLYTTGNVLETTPPPAALDIAVANGRAWIISGDNLSEVWPSKILEPGVAPEFNGAIKLRAPGASVELTALAALDEKVIIFAKDRIFYATGEGPNNLGQGPSFIGPKLISTDVGCINKNSVVEGPFGVMFQSQKGIYLLDRGLNLTFVGAPVESEVDRLSGSGAQISDAVLVRNQNQVRFSFDGEGANTEIIVYDYFHEQWFTHFKYGGPIIDIQSACLWNGEYAMLGTGEVFRETPGIHEDSGAHIPTRVVTGWFTVSAIQGYQRIWRSYVLGSYESSGDVAFEVGFDYEPAFTQSRVWTGAEIIAMPPIGAPAQLGVHLNRQKTQSVRFRIREFAGLVSGGAGLSMDSFSLEGKLKSTLYKGRNVVAGTTNPTRK